MTLPADAVAWEWVRRLTFVPFLADGRCALLPAGDGLALPSGEVLAGEDPILDTGLRVPLVTAGFRRQGRPGRAGRLRRAGRRPGRGPQDRRAAVAGRWRPRP
jgi:hypothetical protein